MSDTKKEWAHTPLAEKIAKIAIQVIVLFIGGILPYFAYFVPAENSWPAVWISGDPGYLVAAVWTVYAAAVFMLSGILFYIPSVDDDEEPWKAITKWSTIFAVLGLLLLISI